MKLNFVEPQGEGYKIAQRLNELRQIASTHDESQIQACERQGVISYHEMLIALAFQGEV